MWDRLTSSNLDEYTAHLLALSHEDRRLRFAGLMTDQAIINYVNKINMLTDVIVVYREKPGEIVGACHLGFLNTNHVEIGISVNSDQRGKGIGTKLLKRSMVIARMRNAKKITLVCLSSNKWVVKKVTEFNMQKHYESGECEASGDYGLPSREEYGIVREQYADEFISMNQQLFNTLVSVTQNSMKMFVPRTMH